MTQNSQLMVKRRSLQAVVCGSFRRDPGALYRDFLHLQAAGCTVVSPVDLDFVDEVDGFVIREEEQGRSTREIENLHLRAMERADLVWLHCPEGYVGNSAAMELGFAQGIGIRVFAKGRPTDVALADRVELCDSPAAAVSLVEAGPGDAPGHGLLSLQSYYARISARRGWDTETVDDTLGLLKGELAELEQALQESGGRDSEEARLELADVQLYLVHLANVLGADLGDAVTVKERINADRFESEPERLAA
jgi:NTP pyrophosphatase (non-canonical NTP hydrolase)